MNSPAVDIATILEENMDNNLFVSKEPAVIDPTVTVYDGVPNNISFTLDGTTYEIPAVQIRIKDYSYEAGWKTVQEISEVLDQARGQEWNGTYYVRFTHTSDPTSIGKDKQGKIIIVMNLETERRRR